MNTNDEVKKLIDLKCEGDFWDFKEVPAENKANLLHDILCLSNSLYTGTKYLIYGVRDPEYGATIKGLIKGQQNRRNQAQFIGFLRTKKFAGDIRPEISLETIIIDNFEIDVLIIQDKPYKPYYLTEDFEDKNKTVYANYIYTRIGDTNTPIDKSADIYIVEKMWSQRFGLHLNSLDRFFQLLKKPNDWYKDIGNVKYCYYKKSPEFRIEFSAPEKFKEPFSLYYLNKTSFLRKGYLKYFSTTLLEIEIMLCDEMRIVLPVPEIGCVESEQSDLYYYYYNLELPPGIFLYFLTNGTLNITSRGCNGPFLIFSNETERIDFDNYLVSNLDLLKDQNCKVVNLNDNIDLPDAIDIKLIGQIAELHKKWKVIQNS